MRVRSILHVKVIKGSLDSRLDAVLANDAGDSSLFKSFSGLIAEMGDVDSDASSVVCYRG